jgi:hypothetical protein
MAVSQQSVFGRTLKAAADLSAKQFFYVGEASGEYDVETSDAQPGTGFLMNAPLAGEYCEVAVEGGGAMAVAGGTISAAEIELMNDTADDGKLIPATTGKFVCAISVEAAADEDIFAVRPVNYYLP